MKKIYAILASIAFAAEILLLAYAIETIVHYTIAGTFLALLFYFVIKTENVIDNYTVPKQLLHPQPKTTKTKKSTKDSKTKEKALTEENSAKTDEEVPAKTAEEIPEKEVENEEESEFLKQWKRLQAEADK
jgi:hypothetical protein